MVKLGDVCEIERGGSPRPIDKFITDDNNGINWIKIGDASADSMYITKTKEKIIREGMKKSRYVQAGDFLLSNSMSFGRPYILKIDGCIHDGWLVLRDKMNHFEKEYLYYALSSKSTYAKFKSLAVGGVVNNLNSKIVKQVMFSLPPLDVQKQIAQTLDVAAELIALRKRQLAELDNLIKATFYDMFGNPVTNEKGWVLKKLPQLVAKSKNSLKRGPFGGALKKEIFVNEGYLIYEQNHALNNDYSFKRYFIDQETFNGLKDFEVKAGDILISCSGVYLGKLSIVPREALPGIINQALLKVTLDNNEMNQIFFVYVFRDPTFKNRYITSNRGSGIPNLPPMPIIKEIDFITPPLSLQNQFAEIVTKIEEQKALVQKAMDESQYLFDSLMSEYFE